MSRFGLSDPAAAWLLLLIPPLVLFYFLKLRRPRVVVASLALWRQVMQDSRVNAPFQRFRRNLLLLLQLLLLLFLVLAAMQPFVRTGPRAGDRLPILIDCSASMAARAEPGGPTRLDEVKSRVHERIDGLLPGQQLCLIAFAEQAHRLTGFTDNRRVLRAALDALRVEEVAGDPEQALRVAAALGRAEPIRDVVLYSDGNLSAGAELAVPFALQYEKVPPGGPNVGITAFNAMRAPGRAWDVFIQIEGAGTGGAAELQILQDGRTLEERLVSADADDDERMRLRIEAKGATQLEARLTPAGFDALAADDVAWLDLPAQRALDVFIAPDLVAYRHALRTMPDLRLHPDPGLAPPPVYDLMVTDRPEDAGEAADVLFTIGIVPPTVEGMVTVEEDAGTAVVDWQRGATLLRHVNLDDLVISDRVRLRDGVAPDAAAGAGFETLVHGRHGPLVLRQETDRQERYHVLFHTARSTWPYRVAFPVFVHNIVAATYARHGMHEVHAADTGVLPPLLLEPEGLYRIEGPDGSVQERAADAVGRLRGVQASRAGVYTVRDGLRARGQVGASLLSTAETSLRVAESLTVGELTVQAGAALLDTARPLWRLLALFGFALLIAEWWWFQRRPA